MLASPPNPPDEAATSTVVATPWTARNVLPSTEELRLDPRGDRVRLGANGHGDRILVGPGLFQRVELALQEGGRHEMPVSLRHATPDQLRIAF